jgi:hypothetical protein
MNKARSNLAKGPDEIFWRIEVEILTGKLEEFRATVQDLIASSNKNLAHWSTIGFSMQKKRLVTLTNTTLTLTR